MAITKKAHITQPFSPSASSLFLPPSPSSPLPTLWAPGTLAALLESWIAPCCLLLQGLCPEILFLGCFYFSSSLPSQHGLLYPAFRSSPKCHCFKEDLQDTHTSTASNLNSRYCFLCILCFSSISSITVHNYISVIFVCGVVIYCFYIPSIYYCVYPLSLLHIHQMDE